MKTIGNKSSRVLLIASALVLLSAVGLLWVIVVRETERKDLVLEYEAFRASSAIVDEYRKDQAFTPEGDERIVGFGFYKLDGSSFLRYGTAPETVSIEDELWRGRAETGNRDLPGSVSVSFPADKKTIRLLRYSGLQNPARMMGSGGNGPGMGMGRGRQTLSTVPGAEPGTIPAAPGFQAALNESYFIWMEYSTDNFTSERLQFFLVAAAITLILVGLFIVLIRVFRHNEDLKAREAETRELVQLGEAARTLVHEIKNPLGIMRIQTAKIRRAASIGDMEKADGGEAAARRAAQLADSADIIDGEILRLSGLADRIREFLKSGPVRRESLDLVRFLNGFCGRYRDLADSGIDLEPEIPAGGGGEGRALVLADADKLVIALDNLLRNAIEAVEGLPEGRRRINVKLFRREASWVIAVIDSGPGVPPDVRWRMFDPFFTTKEKGSGIGLALSKRLVESFGGILAYEGGDGGSGAVFTVSLKEEKTPPA
jgi:two-component system sensor histidine kinase HydH